MSEWISVKKALPEENGKYLVTVKRFYGNAVCIENFTHDLHSVDEYDFEDEHRPGWYSYDSEYGYAEALSVIAWQKLPDPYKENINE